MTSPYPAVPDQPGHGPPPPGQWGAPPGQWGAPPGPYGYGPPPPSAPAPFVPGPFVPGPFVPGPLGPAPFARRANPVGITIALVGGVLALLGAFLDWYRDVVLGDIVDALDAADGKAFPKAYFGWLMWVLLAATVVTALFANLPRGASTALRVLSPVLGLLGAGLVLVSLNDLLGDRGGSVFDRSAVGLYATLIGFVVAGVGGVLGPRRERLR